MRFAKARIWEERSPQGLGPDNSPHINQTLKAWISIWLDLVNNDKAIVTRRAGVVNLLSLLKEVIKRVNDVREGFDSGLHRLESVVTQLEAYMKRDPMLESPTYAPSSLLRRYCEELLKAVRAPRSNLDGNLHKETQALTRRYGCKDLDDLKRHLMKQLQVAASRLLRIAAHEDHYLRDSVHALRRLLAVDPLSEEQQEQVLYVSASVASQFMLRGHSPQSLSELHMLPFRADNKEFEGLSLQERLDHLFENCISTNRSYTVYARLTPALDPGDIPQHRIALLSENQVQMVMAQFLEESLDGDFMEAEDSSYVRIEYSLAEGNGLVSDEFSACETARVEIGNALNVLYLLKSKTVHVNDTFLVESLPVIDKKIRKVNILQERSVSQEDPSGITVDDPGLDTNEPQPGLLRALHWFRKASTSVSDESGLLEAWISLEYLAQDLKESPRESEIAAVQRYFPPLLAMRIVTREIEYLLWCVRNHIPFKENLPELYSGLVSDLEAERIDALILFFNGTPSDRQLLLDVLNSFPHASWEALRLARRLGSQKKLSECLQELKCSFEAMFYWVYALRNEIVHNARMTSAEVPVLRRTFNECLRELYYELLIAHQFDQDLTVEAYLEECRQEFDQITSSKEDVAVETRILMWIKCHFRPPFKS